MNQINPYQSPSEYSHDDTDYEYAGFWIRVVAQIIDMIIWLILWFIFIFILSMLGVIDIDRLFDPEQGYTLIDIISNVLYAVIVIACWVKFGGTPGKRLLKLRVLVANTGDPLTIGQAVLRYIGYFPSMFLLLIGCIWVAFDAKKQGWHDKIAKTVVVKEV